MLMGPKIRHGQSFNAPNRNSFGALKVVISWLRKIMDLKIKLDIAKYIGT